MSRSSGAVLLNHAPCSVGISHITPSHSLRDLLQDHKVSKTPMLIIYEEPATNHKVSRGDTDYWAIGKHDEPSRALKDTMCHNPSTCLKNARSLYKCVQDVYLKPCWTMLSSSIWLTDTVSASYTVNSTASENNARFHLQLSQEFQESITHLE